MSIAKGVNRGYLKIEGAARAFNFDFRDKVVLDIGSSTGGFTEYALDHGAKKVIAVEKGSHQMKAPLCFDPRVELHEKTDIFDVISSDQRQVMAWRVTKMPQRRGLSERGSARMSAGRPWRWAGRTRPQVGHFVRTRHQVVSPIPDTIMADVSFISLKPILKHAKEHLAGEHTEFLMMLKPQFEARPDQLVKGVVKNEKIRREIIKDFEQWLKHNNFIIVKKRDNSLHGKTGNLERFYYLTLAK